MELNLEPQTMPASTALIYHCPMHPEIRQDHPGHCPKCQMLLVPEGRRSKAISMVITTVITTATSMVNHRRRTPHRRMSMRPSNHRQRRLERYIPAPCILKYGRTIPAIALYAG